MCFPTLICHHNVQTLQVHFPLDSENPERHTEAQLMTGKLDNINIQLAIYGFHIEAPSFPCSCPGRTKITKSPLPYTATFPSWGEKLKPMYFTFEILCLPNSEGALWLLLWKARWRVHFLYITVFLGSCGREKKPCCTPPLFTMWSYWGGGSFLSLAFLWAYTVNSQATGIFIVWHLQEFGLQHYHSITARKTYPALPRKYIFFLSFCSFVGNHLDPGSCPFARKGAHVSKEKKGVRQQFSFLPCCSLKPS